MEKQENIKVCKNKSKEKALHGHMFCCAVLKANSDRLCFYECAAHPSFVNSVGHCTGVPYTSVWFGQGPQNTDIETLCPGCNNPSATKEEIEGYKTQIAEGLKDYARRLFKEKGIEQQVI